MNKFEDYMTPIDRKEEARAVAAMLDAVMPKCSAGDEKPCAVMPSLAMVYSPEQYWRDIYEPCEALERGTLFSELYFPLDREKGRK